MLVQNIMCHSITVMDNIHLHYAYIYKEENQYTNTHIFIHTHTSLHKIKITFIPKPVSELQKDGTRIVQIQQKKSEKKDSYCTIL